MSLNVFIGVNWVLNVKGCVSEVNKVGARMKTKLLPLEDGAIYKLFVSLVVSLHVQYIVILYNTYKKFLKL